MKKMIWAVPLFIVLTLALCLHAAKKPNSNQPSIPPGINEADWHSLSDEFGYVLQVTKESHFLVTNSVIDKEIKAKKKEISEILKEIRDINIDNTSAEELELLKLKLKKKQEELQPLLKERDENPQELNCDAVGEAQICFFARNGEKWYAISTPHLRFGPHWIQQ